MDATKGENEAGQLWNRWRQFRNAFASYELLLRNFLRNEVFSDLILPENFETEPEEADNLEHMVLQMQWIAIAYAAIRQSLFLNGVWMQMGYRQRRHSIMRRCGSIWW